VVCPPRGSQEVTAQILQEIDGIYGDTHAIFLVGSTNRPDQVDNAILSRFSERIEIPLPDTPTRAALLQLFLSPLPFCGDRAPSFAGWLLTRPANAAGICAAL
jgi:AAA+ superfamily predicted ATPase